MNWSIMTGIFPIVAFVFLSSLVFEPTSQSLIRARRHSEAILSQILEQHEEDIFHLHEKARASDKLFENIHGFLNSIGFGHSVVSNSNAQPCGDETDGWLHFIGHKCIKVIDNLQNFEDAETFCHQQFKKDKDIEYPGLVFVDTEEKQAILVDHLKNIPQITSVWITHANAFTNWTSSQSGTRRGCTELLNDSERRGGWMDVSCLRVNSIICEKTAPMLYSQVIQSLHRLKVQNTFLKNTTEVQLGELRAFITEQVKDGNRQASLNSMEKRVAMLERKYQELMENDEQFESAIAFLTTKDSELETNYVGLTAKDHQMKSSIVSLRTKVGLLDVKNSDLETNYGELTAKNEQMESAIASLQRSNALSSLKNSELDRIYTELMKKDEEIEAVITSLRSKNTELEKQFGELRNQSQAGTTQSAPNKILVPGPITLHSRSGNTGTNVTVEVAIRCTNVPSSTTTDSVGSVNTHDRCMQLYALRDCGGGYNKLFPGNGTHSHWGYGGQAVKSVLLC